MANNTRRGGTSARTGGTIVGFLMLLLVVAFVWMAVKGLYSILSFVAPVLFIITLFLNFGVVKDYGKMLINTFKTNAGKGILYILGTAFFSPLVIAYLFSKALISRQFSQRKKQQYDDYEDVTEKEKAKQQEDEEDFLELPDIEKVPQTRTNNPGTSSRSTNEYEDLF